MCWPADKMQLRCKELGDTFSFRRPFKNKQEMGSDFYQKAEYSTS